MNSFTKNMYFCFSLFKNTVLLLTLLSVFSVTFIFVASPVVSALPFPKNLVVEKSLNVDQKKVVFKDFTDRLPADSRHMIIEVFAATASDGTNHREPATVKLTFNGDSDFSYVNRSLYAEGERLGTELLKSSDAASLMKIPPAGEGRFGGGQSFVPWAFLDDQKKHLLTHGAANESYFSANMSHWVSLQPISSVQLELEGGGSFTTGSTFKLYVVDEDYRIHETALRDNEDGIRFSNISQNYGDLIVIGQTRSSEVNPRRRGDRVWYSINGDNQSNRYQIQRLTGEANVYQEGRETEQNKIVHNQMPEPRVGWSSADSAPNDVFGPWALYYPEYANNAIWRTFLSRHGVYDNHFNPIGNEIGRWTSSASIEDLHFYPQRGEAFRTGSRIGIYQPKEPTQRYVVAEGGEQTISLSLHNIENSDSLQIHIAARSENTELDEDSVLIEVNSNSKVANYARQAAMAYNNTSTALSADDNEIGVLPAGGGTDERLMSSTYVSLMGFRNEDKQTAFLSYGGIPGDGSIAFYGGRWKQQDGVKRLTFRTKSGAPFSAGSIITVWTNNSSDSEIDQVEHLNPSRSITIFLAASLLVLTLLVLKKFEKTGEHNRK